MTRDNTNKKSRSKAKGDGARRRQDQIGEMSEREGDMLKAASLRMIIQDSVLLCVQLGAFISDNVICANSSFFSHAVQDIS